MIEHKHICIKECLISFGHNRSMFFEVGSIVYLTYKTSDIREINIEYWSVQLITMDTKGGEYLNYIGTFFVDNMRFFCDYREHVINKILEDV